MIQPNSDVIRTPTSRSNNGDMTPARRPRSRDCHQGFRCIQARDLGVPLGCKMRSEPRPTRNVDEARAESDTQAVEQHIAKPSQMHTENDPDRRFGGVAKRHLGTPLPVKADATRIWQLRAV